MHAPDSQDTTPVLGSSSAGTRPFSLMRRNAVPLTPLLGSSPNCHCWTVYGRWSASRARAILMGFGPVAWACRTRGCILYLNTGTRSAPANSQSNLIAGLARTVGVVLYIYGRWRHDITGRWRPYARARRGATAASASIPFCEKLIAGIVSVESPRLSNWQPLVNFAYPAQFLRSYYGIMWAAQLVRVTHIAPSQHSVTDGN